MGFIAPERDIGETQFQPLWSPEVTQRRLKAYYRVPHTFTAPQLEILQKHANHYNIDMPETDQTVHDDDIKLTRLMRKMGEGFFSGFTTLHAGDEPRNEAEAIANSLGHLAGFIGYIPTAPLKALQATKLVNAAQAIRGKSIPMLAATQVQKIAKPAASKILDQAHTMRAQAAKDAVNFIRKDVPKHMLEGAFHLGVASAVGSWQGGIDEMISAGAHGAIAGGAFRGIANLINKGGAKTLVKTVEKDHMGRPKPAKQVLTLDQKQDKALRALAGSLFQGLPSTMRGDTTATQVYNYLLGAYFGAHETTAVEMARNKFLGKMTATNSEFIRSAQKVGVEKGLKGKKLIDFVEKETSDKLNFVPELMPEWEKLSPEVKEAAKSEAANLWGYKSDSRYAGLEMLEKILGKEGAEEALEFSAPSGFEETGEIKHGDRMIRPIKGTNKIYKGGSGAAEGADTLFSTIGERYGVDFAHYSFKGHTGSKKAVGERVILTDAQLSEANDLVSKAMTRLNKPLGSKYVQNLIRRNYFQVVNSEGVFAIGEIVRKDPKKDKSGKVVKGQDPTPKDEVKGGTGWAIAMAKELGGREIHVWDVKSKKWNKWNRKKKRWEIEETPKLTNDFAGIGSRGVGYKPKGKKKTVYRPHKGMEEAIEGLYENTFGPAKVKSKKEQAKIKKQKDKLVKGIGVKTKYSKLTDKELDKKIKEEVPFENEVYDELIIEKKNRTTSNPQKKKIISELGYNEKEARDAIFSDVDVEGGSSNK